MPSHFIAKETEIERPWILSRDHLSHLANSEHQPSNVKAFTNKEGQPWGGGGAWGECEKEAGSHSFEDKDGAGRGICRE